MRVLLVEGDETAADGLRRELGRHGFVVDAAGSGAAAMESVHEFELLLLDLELPDLDGLEVCRRIRAHCDIPIIATSERDTEVDRVIGLRAGLDDYVVKPVGLQELVARMHAVMRRMRPRRVPGQLLAHGNLVISPRTREVRVDDRLVFVTRKEFDLLALLASEPGAVFSRERIVAAVWKDDSSLTSRTIDTHISTLRNKLGSRSSIITVRGVGFRLGP
ncbi:response regulator transcription factor [Saccharopolyspora taberi]|uniref:Response regulator transcription factor n=1 Tax=Saccharopolyspora taberi TaxID=60895 RepID=A0ABN3VBQ3_9PSEU